LKNKVANAAAFQFFQLLKNVNHHGGPEQGPAVGDKENK
jgi:hypothetical protein